MPTFLNLYLTTFFLFYPLHLLLSYCRKPNIKFILDWTEKLIYILYDSTVFKGHWINQGHWTPSRIWRSQSGQIVTVCTLYWSPYFLLYSHVFYYEIWWLKPFIARCASNRNITVWAKLLLCLLKLLMTFISVSLEYFS